MPTRPHFEDLRRRYRETDWVSELQRLWAIFNHWFAAEFSGSTDRSQIEALKTDSRLGAFVEGVIQKTPYYRTPYRLTDGYGGAYPRFATNNVISRFFREAAASPVLEAGRVLPWSPSTGPRPARVTNTITLTSLEFKKLYRHHGALLDRPSNMIVEATLHQTLPALGVRSTGSCFWRVKSTAVDGVHSAFAADLVARCTNVPSFFNLASSSAPLTTIESDVLETLYQARNAAMHGSLDFLVPADNAAARSSCDLLDALIQDVRANW